MSDSPAQSLGSAWAAFTVSGGVVRDGDSPPQRKASQGPPFPEPEVN